MAGIESPEAVAVGWPTLLEVGEEEGETRPRSAVLNGQRCKGLLSRRASKVGETPAPRPRRPGTRYGKLVSWWMGLTTYAAALGQCISVSHEIFRGSEVVTNAFEWDGRHAVLTP